MEAKGHLGILGVSASDAGAAALAGFTVSRDERVARLPALAGELGADEVVYLATCHRVEVLFRGRGPAGSPLEALGRWLGSQTAPVEASLRGWTGTEAVRRLFSVAAGLDSPQLGEREIQGQLRDALADARQAGTSGVVVDQLVEEALRVARQVHRGTRLGAGRLSLAEIAAELLLERVARTPSEVALVGVSPMTRRCAEILRRESQPWIVVNRTPERGEALASELGGRAMPLAEFRSRPPRVEAILCATGAPGAVLDRATLERLGSHTASREPPLVVDLAVPPDVEPEAALAAELPRVGMDEVRALAEAQRAGREAEAEPARRLVEQALAELPSRLRERALAPVLRGLQERYRLTAMEGIERLTTLPGAVPAATDRDALERWAETLARRFAHLPTLGLRGLAAREGLAAVRSFLEASGEAALADLSGPAAELERFAAALEEEGGELRSDPI